jgi:thymidylate kinase
MHEANYHVLQEWYDYIDEHHMIKCDLFIYIQTEPEIAFKRMQARAREEESKVTLDYVREIHALHEKVFVERAINLLPAKVLIIDGNLTQDEMLQEYKKCEAEIFA